jgi:hypothetical protein
MISGNLSVIQAFATNGVVIPKFRIVKLVANDQVALATAATDLLIGTIDDIPKGANDRTADIQIAYVAPIEYGGTVTAGAELTSDAQGRAITATVAGSRLIGIALQAGVLGDISQVLISRGKF